MKFRATPFLPFSGHWLVLVCLCSMLLAGCASTGRQAGASATDTDSPETTEGADAEVIRVPTSEEVMYRVFAAEYLGSEGDLEGAVGEYLVAALESEDPEIARRATRVAFAAESWQEAVMAADRWALLDPQSVSAHESAAAAMLAVGDYLGAEYHMMQMLDLMDDSTDAWLMVSSLLAGSGDPKQADLVLQQLLAEREDANRADVFYARSQLAVQARNIDRAYDLAVEAVEADPDRVQFLTWAGRLALNLEQRDEALDFIRRAWKLDPDDHDLALAYADLLAQSGDADGARKVMKKMEQTPDVMLSRILFELSARNEDGAEDLFGKFEEMNFDDPAEKAFYQAQAAEALGKNSLAVDYYGQVDTGKHALPAALRRAELLAERGELELARTELEQVRQFDDPLAIEEGWLAEARILRQAGDLEQAFEVMEVAVREVPDSVPLLYTHSLFAAELGWVDIAETDLRKILQVQPENAAALNALGYTLADQTERYEEAEALIRQAYILQPQEPSIIDSMGWIAYRLGKYEEAIKFLERAWSLDKNPEIAAHLGEVLWVSGERDKAMQIWREGQAQQADNRILLETLERLDIEL